ncbi:hypothetical protein [Dactylosporangium sp. CA-139066]|uniref:hypothetical protein n=1 Tax=Dactylosporangium sp. CA-139066 TaxID=3239930 RepID=UPI003D8D1126
MTTTFQTPSRRRQVRAAQGVGWYRTRDLDEVAVLRATWGDHLKLTTAERDAAIAQLDQQGLAGAEIARRVGCSQRTVARRRAARMAAGGPAPAIVAETAQTAQLIAVLDTTGLSGPQVAALAGVSVSTVYYHRARRAEAGRAAA